MQNVLLVYKWFGASALGLFCLLAVLREAPGSLMLGLAAFMVASSAPLVLLFGARKMIRTSALHLILGSLAAIVGMAMLSRYYLYGFSEPSLLVVLAVILPVMAIMADLVLNDEIGRPPRKRFRLLVRDGKIVITINLLLLVGLGVLGDAVDRLGLLQYCLMLASFGAMLYCITTTEGSRSAIRAIGPLLVGGTWNFAISAHSKFLAEPSWSAALLLGFGCLNTAYKLGRSPLPDRWEETFIETVRPTQSLKRTPDGAA